MTDFIFVQVIFSRLCVSSYKFENKEKYNMNFHFIKVYTRLNWNVQKVFCQFTLVIQK